MELTIRRAGPDDAAGIAAVHVTSWRETYDGIFPADKLAALSVEDRTRQWREWLAGSSTHVACDDGAVVGFVHAGPSRDPEGLDEIVALYVLRSHWGRGAGRELLRASLDDLEREAVVLWVLERNERARRFYEKAGFVDDGVSKPAGIFGSAEPKMRYRRERGA